MTTSQLKEILLKEHVRDKKLTYIGVFIILAVVIVIASLLYMYAYDQVATIISNFGQDTTNTANEIDSNPYSSYYKFIIPIAFLSVLALPIIKFLKLKKRHEKIEQFIAKVDNGLIAMDISQSTIYKFSIPLLKVNIKLSPVELVHIVLDQDPDLKPYVFPIPLTYIPELKTLLSGVSAEKVNKAWYELYGDSGSTDIPEVKLKSEEEFSTFLTNELSSEINKQDEERVAGKAMYKKGMIISIIAVLLFGGGIAFFNFSGIEMSQTTIFIGVGALFGAYYIYVIIAAMKNKKNPPLAMSGNSFKMKIFKPIVEFINPNFQFILHGHIDLPELLETGLLENKNYEISGNDQIIGSHMGVPFQLSDLSVEYKRNFTSEKERPDSVFGGQVFIAKFNKSFSSELYLIPKKKSKQKLKENISGAVGLGNLGIGASTQKGTDIDMYTGYEYGNKVELEDPDFMSRFKVYGKDQVEARYLLTPALMERIKNIADKTKGDLYISFRNNKISILNNSGKNNFEAGFFSSLGNEDNKLLKEFYKDLCDQLTIIEDLKLNINIWKK